MFLYFLLFLGALSIIVPSPSVCLIVPLATAALCAPTKSLCLCVLGHAINFAPTKTREFFCHPSSLTSASNQNVNILMLLTIKNELQLFHLTIILCLPIMLIIMLSMLNYIAMMTLILCKPIMTLD